MPDLVKANPNLIQDNFQFARGQIEITMDSLKTGLKAKDNRKFGDVFHQTLLKMADLTSKDTHSKPKTSPSKKEATDENMNDTLEEIKERLKNNNKNPSIKGAKSLIKENKEKKNYGLKKGKGEL